MTPDMIDHAARLLEREPTRSMDGAALHRRTCRETGEPVALAAFLALLEERPERFAVLRTGRLTLDSTGWRADELYVYDAVLRRAGADCLIALAEPSPRPFAATTTWAAPPSGPARRSTVGDPGELADTDGSAAFLADLHASAAHLLAAAADDDELRGAALDAVRGLAEIRARLESGRPSL